MDDEQILERGGTQYDINEYAKQNGADLTREDIIEDLQQKIKDAPNSYMKRKYMIELQEMNKDKPVSLLRGTSKMIIKKGKPVIK